MRSRGERRRSGRWGTGERSFIVRAGERLGFEALESRRLFAGVDAKPVASAETVVGLLADDGGGGAGQFSGGTPAAPPASKGPSRIVGGSPSALGAWPWMASLQQGGHFCGGTLVAADAIVTAAHCVEGASARQLSVLLGSNELAGGGGKRHEVNEILVHPDYNSFTNDSDVAILLLASPSDEKPLPILTPNLSELAAAGVLAVVAGWGVESEGNSRPPNELREVTVPIVSNEVANEPQAYGGAITDHMLAAGLAAGGKDSCQGDSGGPLMVPDANGQYYLAGIVSWGDGCARPNKYGIYTRVTSFTGWIEERTRVSPAGSINFSQDRYAVGQTAKLLLKDLDLVGLGSVEIQVQADNGDQEQITLLESGPGRFAGTVALYGGPVSVNDSQLQVAGSRSITASYQDQDDGTGQQVTVTSSARIVVDDHGNQSTTATPLSVPGSVGAEIELTGDVDWFRVQATADKVYAIDVLLDGSLNDSVLTLFDESGEVVLDTDDDSGPGFASSLLWRPPVDQILNVQVAGYGSFVGTYRLQVNTSEPSADDHGNNSVTATPVSVGNTTAGRIEIRNDRDWFAFSAVQGTTYRITSDLLSLSDSVLRLIDPQGVTEIAYNDDFGGGFGSEITWTAVASGNLFIEVTGYDESIGSYELTVAESTLPADDHGNLAATATPIVIPSRTPGTIDAGQDLDWFAFNAVANSQYVFSVDLAGLSDSILRLLDNEFEELEFNDDFDFSPASRIAWTAPTSGRYYLEVSAFDEEDTGSYDLVTAVAGGGDADDHGDSADTATELTLPSVMTAAIDPIGDRDYFRFTAVAGLYYEIETTAGSLSDTLVTLYDTDGTTLLLHDDDSGDGFASFLRWQAPATGSYTVAVEGFAQTTGSYDLRVEVPLGDSNLDRVFDSSDLVLVFQRGEYEDEIFGNSAWDDGDWTGDGEFSTADLVAAFQAGVYV